MVAAQNYVMLNFAPVINEPRSVYAPAHTNQINQRAIWTFIGEFAEGYVLGLTAIKASQPAASRSGATFDMPHFRCTPESMTYGGLAPSYTCR